jgi:regulator of RNase E activity RraA
VPEPPDSRNDVVEAGDTDDGTEDDDTDGGADQAGVLGSLTAAGVSDACDELGIPAVRTGALRPAWPGCPALAGPVATLTMRPAEDSPRADPLPDILRAMAGLAGRLVLVDLDGRTDMQCWGGVLTACAQRWGIPGAVINGAVRDTAEIAGRGFPVFARSVHPARIRGRLRLAASGADVMVDGAVVHSGDIVIADGDGAVFLPSADFARARRLAARRAADERELLSRLAAGDDPRDLLGRGS